MGRVSRLGGAPSSNEIETLRVGPIRRMTRNPVHVIRCSAMRCQSVNGRSDVDVRGETEDVRVALTMSIVASLNNRPRSDRRPRLSKRAHGAIRFERKAPRRVAWGYASHAATVCAGRLVDPRSAVG